MKKLKVCIALVAAGLAAMATPLIISAFCVTAPVAITGCGILGGGGTNTNNIVQINTAAQILQNIAQGGALAAITPPQGNTSNAAYFNAANQTIGLFLTGKDYSPAAFQQALLATKIPGGNDVWVQLAIGGVVDLYQVYFSQYVQGQVNGNYAAQALLIAVQNGFNQALGNPLIPLPQPPASVPLKAGQHIGGPILPRPISK